MFDLVPAGTIGTREMINRVFEKITGEELVIPVERLKRSEFEDMVLLPGYSLKGDPKEIPQALLNAYGILCESLQKGELVLEVEDQTSKRYAVPACKAATNDGLITIVTGTFISPGRGDKQQTVCFSDREKFSEWLSSRFPDDTDETRKIPAPSITSANDTDRPKRKPASDKKLETWYKRYITLNQDAQSIPNQQADYEAVRENFKDSVTRDRIRELRRRIAPEEWKTGKSGPKPKQTAG